MPKKKKKKKGGAKAAAPSAFAMLAGSNPEEAEQFLNVARTMLVGNDGTTEGSKWSEKRRHHTSTRSSLSPNPVSLCLSVSVSPFLYPISFVCRIVRFPVVAVAMTLPCVTAAAHAITHASR